MVSIIIPCLNEKETIREVIDSAKKAVYDNLGKDSEIIVADNGSTDGTLALVRRIKGIRLVQIPIKGYGAALHYAILKAKYSYIFFADADLSYDFGELGKFIPFIKKNYDLVLGTRMRGNIEKGAMPILNRYIGTPILTFLIRIIYGIKTTDCNSGMRMVKKSFYKSLKMKNSGMEWASELLIKTRLHGGKYAEVPITFYRDKRINRPHLRRWEDGWRHLKAIILLQPMSLIYLASLFILAAIFYFQYSLFTTIVLGLYAEFLIFSYLIAKRLQAVIEKKQNRISDILDRVPFVIIAVVGTLLGFLQLVIIPDTHIFTKYILFFQVVLFDLWLFFLETIKTHLVNPLPERIN